MFAVRSRVDHGREGGKRRGRGPRPTRMKFSWLTKRATLSWLKSRRIPKTILASLCCLTLPCAALAQTVHIQGPAGPLGGIATAPAPIRAAALIIPGSGAIDHDGNGPEIETNLYADLATALAAQGVATLRVDKRGLFLSASTGIDPNAVSIEDYAADTGAWIKAATQRFHQTCVWLIGHSEGGLVALTAAGQFPHVCGLVLLATPGVPMGDVLHEQLTQHLAGTPLLKQADAAIAALEAGRAPDTAAMDPHLAPLFRPAVRKLLISEFAIDPAELAKSDRLPVTVLRGARDLQVSAADVAPFAQDGPRVRLVTLQGVNHAFKAVGPSPHDNLASFANPNLPLASGVAAAVARGLGLSSSRP